MGDKYDQFINQYPVSKTLKFRLIPLWSTEDNYIARHYLESDRQRAFEYAQVKKMIDAMLRRNLVYTAVTRAKQHVVMMGELDALETAVHNNKADVRYTLLAARLRQKKQTLTE